jgi:hypothetical protein
MHVVVVFGVMSHKPPCPGINSIKKLSELKKEFERDSLGKEYYEEIVELFEVGDVDEFSPEQQEIFDFLERVISRSLFRRERRQYAPDLSRNQFSVLQDDDSDDEDDECDDEDYSSDEENVISFYGDDSEYSSDNWTDIEEYDDYFELPYIEYATNNLQSLLNDNEGARCVFCLGHPEINEDTLTTDESTVLCPLCGVDAVVPASVVPNELTLHSWHMQGF